MGIRWSPAGVLAVLCVAFLGCYLLRETLWPLLPNWASSSSLRGPRVSASALLCAAVVAAERGGVEVRRVQEAQLLNARNKGSQETRNPVTDGDLRSHYAMARTLELAFGGGLKVVSEEHGASETFPNLVVGTVDKACPEELMDNSAAASHFVHLQDVQVWIDPLDATQEYTENLLHYVTTMVGISIKGKAVAGVIHKPFGEDPGQRTYWAWTDVAVSGNLEAVKSLDGDSSDTNSGAADSARPHKLIVSRSHTGDVEEVARVAFQGRPMEIELAGGAGYKTLQVILGRASLYLHTTLIKKWDLCAPNGLLTALGGRMTTIQGRDIYYGAPLSEADVVSHGGVVAALDGHAHYLDVLALLHPVTQKAREDS